MRTSRISRDTHKVITTLPTTRTQPLRQSRVPDGVLQNYSLNAAVASDVTVYESARPSAREQSDSELSSVPDEAGTSVEAEIRSSATRKRKRKSGQNAPDVSTTVSCKSEEVSTVDTSPLRKQSNRPKKVRRVPAKKKIAPDGSVEVEPPPNWELTYSLTREMRAENVAPVDTMGCESLADTKVSKRDRRFQTLVALMLSSQTKDTVTAVAIRNMQENLPGGFNLESILVIEPPVLNSFINKVGFHNLKTKYIKSAAEILREKHKSDIPDSIEGLTSLPGVGPKMAYLCMSAAWGRDEGIGVDVHVHRITNLWGWHKTKTPEETRSMLQSWLPKNKWHDINNLLVGFGQTICVPVRMKCGECKLADRGLCPSAVVGKVSKMKKHEVVIKDEGGIGGHSVREEVDTIVQHDVKAEDVEGGKMVDIEDLGRPPRRRSSRLTL